jgi:hypothetical protein
MASARGAAVPGDREGGATETARSLALLLEAGQLPGTGWHVVQERSWVTGELDPESEKSRRARDAGVVTAWRSFEEAVTGRSAWVEVVPYATAEDAELSLRQAPRFFVGTEDPEAQVVVEGVVDRLLPGVPNAWIYEKSVTELDGLRLTRYVAGTIGPVLFITSVSGGAEDWRLDDLLALAAAQAIRVREG